VPANLIFNFAATFRATWLLHYGPSTSKSLISQPVRAELVEAYSALDRHDHDLHQIEALLGLMREHVAILFDPPTVEAAIWSYYAIYDTHRQDNEQGSSDFARERVLCLHGSHNLGQRSP
jgi:predicted metal-dependent HD superfamily phosphohydrolase